MPQKPIMRRARSALQDFLDSEAAGGLMLMAAAALAMIVANSPAAPAYFAALHFRTGPVIAPALGPMTVHLWINDGLMALFFLLVGLEIKREVVSGELAAAGKDGHRSTHQDASSRRLPIIAAAAGMAVPALVYLGAVSGNAALRPGWAIPAATDIAFAVGVLALLGRRVPASLRLFLTTVAIVDDMGAVAIIAVVYNHGLQLFALGAAMAVAVAMWSMNRRGVTALRAYLAGFALLWVLVMLSGVHATIAGVVTAMLVPARGGHSTTDTETSPLHRLEHALNPWVAYGVVPLFGFANAGVALSGMHLSVLGEPLVIGIAAGLFLGKQAGIFGSIALAERFRLARRPAGVSWAQMYGVALLAGIGFTMSLFIGGLAFPGNDALIDEIKIAVLLGSLLSAVAGYLVLRFAAPPTGDT